MNASRSIVFRAITDSRRVPMSSASSRGERPAGVAAGQLQGLVTRVATGDHVLERLEVEVLAAAIDDTDLAERITYGSPCCGRFNAVLCECRLYAGALTHGRSERDCIDDHIDRTTGRE